MINDEAIKSAISLTIAKDILSHLNTEHRDAILVESIKKALTSYSVSSVIEKVVAERAIEIAKEMLQQEDWTIMITESITKSFESYKSKLRFALEATLVKSLHGDKPGTAYPSATELLRYWPKD